MLIWEEIWNSGVIVRIAAITAIILFICSMLVVTAIVALSTEVPKADKEGSNAYKKVSSLFISLLLMAWVLFIAVVVVLSSIEITSFWRIFFIIILFVYSTVLQIVCFKR